ncbi:putative bifunctional diguanylate cyclase/phosphodiesterase [Vreelandella lutescens]|nr:bifunctional diguanylate cyclase/phosphodiesterase [Halomonas lutescens]
MFGEDVDFAGLFEFGARKTPVGIVLVDAQSASMPIVFANKEFYNITGYSKGEVLGKNCRFLQGMATNKDTVNKIKEAIRESREGRFTILNYRKDGARFWNQLTLSPVINANGICTHYIGFQQDITHQYKQEALLLYQSNNDLLTGLLNRSALDDVLNRMLNSANLANELVVVMYLNLDDFKTINDGLGYEIGNELVRGVSGRLKEFLEPTDVLARLSGDEFAFVFSGFKSYAQANEKANAILESILLPFYVNGIPLHVSASMGISCNKYSKELSCDLMQEASIAMAEAKDSGRNTWCWSNGKSDNISNNELAVNLRYELNSAMIDNQFELFYQPVIDLDNGHVNSYEALIRWHHPEKGMISPGVFIPIAEQTGQIIPLGLWILRQACSDLVSIQAAQGEAAPVAINISPLQFRRAGFFEAFLDIVNEFSLPTSLLQIEVTESLLVDGSRKAIELVEKFSAAGVKVALDDFGTGYSSLSYLRDLPIDKVKLDRSFIKDIDNNVKNAAIVKAVVDMSHSLGLQVVAEGVEEEGQLEVLKSYKCDFIQGFLFSKPLPLLEIIGMKNLVYGVNA